MNFNVKDGTQGYVWPFYEMKNLSSIKHETSVLHQQFFIFLSIVHSLKLLFMYKMMF